MRAAAAEALGHIGDARATEPLKAVLEDRKHDVRTAAAEALDELAWSPDSGEAGAAYWLAKSEWDECVRIGAPAVELLMAALKQDEDDRLRRHASDTLSRIGAPAVEPLLGALIGGHGRVRKAAAEALVAIYQSDKLDEAQKAKLLTQREAIARTHHDQESVYGGQLT